MDDGLLEALLTTPDDGALQALIGAHALDIQAIEALKARSADLYFSRPAEAVRVGAIARRLGALLPDPAPALGRWTLANALLFADRYREAVELFQQARTDYLAYNCSLDAARMGVGQVWALAYTGQFESALSLAAEIEPVLQAAADSSPADRRRLGGLLNNMGILHDLMGQYEEALAAYDRKLETAHALGDELDVARTQHNRACALSYLNAFEESLAAFRGAEAGFLEAGATTDLARLAFNRGTLYARWGRHVEVEAEFVAADRRLSSLENSEQARATLIVYRVLARIEGNLALDEGALGELSAAQALLAAHGPVFEEGLAWLALGRCYRTLDDLSAAQGALQHALEIAREGGGPALAWEALWRLGALAEQGNDSAAAIDLYQQAIAQIEATRRGLYIEPFRAGFLADKLGVYGDLALLYARQGRLADVFATVERAKSRVLAERLIGRLSEEVASLRTVDDAQTLALASRLQDTLQQLEQLYRQARLDQADERRSAWIAAADPDTMSAVHQLEQDVTDLVRQIERRQPQFSSLATGYTAPLRDVQARLGDALLLCYHVAQGQVWVSIVDHAGIRGYQGLAPLADVEAARQRFSAAVTRTLSLSAQYGREMVARYIPSLLADADAHLTTLYDLLLRPLEAYLASGVALVISPDGPLHYVPFHALHDGTAYLVERHVVSYAPSATVLDLCARPAAAGQGMLVMGYGGERLGQVASELQALSDLFPQAELLSEGQATTQRFLGDASRYRLLHLATHARFRTDNAMLSSLALADRQLTLAEIGRLQLDADLVTLSGCETGVGKLYGADLISLACGFLGAGARSLLVTLWRVDDEAIALQVGAFYRALQGGEGRAAALQRAQLDFLALGREGPESGVYRHPAYWAPFVLLGERGKLSGLTGR